MRLQIRNEKMNALARLDTGLKADKAFFDELSGEDDGTAHRLRSIIQKGCEGAKSTKFH